MKVVIMLAVEHRYSIPILLAIARIHAWIYAIETNNKLAMHVMQIIIRWWYMTSWFS